MGTRFGAHFLVLFFVQRVDYQATKMASSPPILAPDSTDHTHPFAHTHTKNICQRQTSNNPKGLVVGHKPSGSLYIWQKKVVSEIRDKL